MNSLQLELDQINEKLEILTYRKSQLDSIMSEYSDVINRVKSLVSSMQDAMIEPSNLLMEIEGIVYGEPELTPIEHLIKEQSEPQQPFTFDLRLFPKAEPIENAQNPDTVDGSAIDAASTPEPRLNRLGLPVATPEPTPEILQAKTPEPTQDNYSSGYKIDSNTIDTNKAFCNRQDIDTEGNTAFSNVENVTTPEQRGNSLLFPPNTYWDNGSSVRMFIPKKRRYKGELEAIINDCIGQGLVEQFEINECGEDWIIQLAPVSSEDTVKRIIGEFYPVHTDGEPEPTPEPKTSNPELLKLMALVPAVIPTPTPEIIDDGVEQEEFLSYAKKHQSTPTPTPKTQLNERAYRRNDTLLIGFDNKRLMISWAKWFNDSFNGAVFVKDNEQLEGFKYCLSVLWYGSEISTNWERLSTLDYSLKPDEQPTGINLDDVRNIILKLQSNGLKFISKGELLAHHLNSLKASDLEDHLDKLAEEGLIILGNKSIDLLPTKTQDNEPDNPTFEYTEVDSKTTKIYNDGMLLGIAKNCGTHWESPQFPGQTFSNRRDVVAGLWELVNKF